MPDLWQFADAHPALFPWLVMVAAIAGILVVGPCWWYIGFLWVDHRDLDAKRARTDAEYNRQFERIVNLATWGEER